MIYDCLESTNRSLLDFAGKTDTHRHAILANRQTGGYGQYGRGWYSPTGGLYLSYGWHLDVMRYHSPGILSTWAGVAVLRALKHFVKKQSIYLKWPNDIYCKQGKLGGILVETGQFPSGKLACIGVGINRKLPADIQWQTQIRMADLERLTQTVPDINDLAVAVITELHTLFLSAATGTDWCAEWERYDLCHGKEVKLELPNGTLGGTAQGIDCQGRLRLLMPTDYCNEKRALWLSVAEMKPAESTNHCILCFSTGKLLIKELTIPQ